jgi:hypothetical protein
MTAVAILALLMIVAAVVIYWPELGPRVHYTGRLYIMTPRSQGKWQEVGYVPEGWTIQMALDPAMQEAEPVLVLRPQEINLKGQINPEFYDRLREYMWGCKDEV